jgi:hypothetical protein
MPRNLCIYSPKFGNKMEQHLHSQATNYHLTFANGTVFPLAAIFLFHMDVRFYSDSYCSIEHNSGSVVTPSLTIECGMRYEKQPLHCIPHSSILSCFNHKGFGQE